jgi:NAD(P)H dehydrogenase (quinone)
VRDIPVRDIVIVYHSGYGHTKRVAEAVAQGSGGELLAIDADGNLPDGAWDRMNAAIAIVFGSPTYMGSVSWQFKKFADASSKAWFGNTKVATRNDVNYVGSFGGLMTATPSDASPDEMVPGDLETARRFGERVAEATAKFARKQGHSEGHGSPSDRAAALAN